MERRFEKLTYISTKILGHPISFMIALVLVIFWWANMFFISSNIHQNIGDVIFGITFLSLFIIQKSFNRYYALLHLKLNALITYHNLANSGVMDTSRKTEREIRELSKKYIDHIDEIVSNSIEE